MTLQEIKQRIKDIDALLKDENCPKRDKAKLKFERGGLDLTKHRCKKVFNLSENNKKEIDKNYDYICHALDELEDKDHNFELCKIIWEAIKVCSKDALRIYEWNETRERIEKEKRKGK